MSDVADALWGKDDSPLKWVTTTAGLSVLCVLLFIVLVVLVTTLWMLRRQSLKVRPDRLVVEGHSRAQAEKDKEASSLYRSAILQLCRKALIASGEMVAVQVEEILYSYNSAKPLYLALAVALPVEVQDAVIPMTIIVSYSNGLEADVDERHFVTAVTPGGQAQKAGVAAGDQLVTLEGDDAEDFTFEELQRKLSKSGRASFRRDNTEDSSILVCSRCGCGNRVADSTQHFRCFSCQATAVRWRFVTAPPQMSATEKMPSFRCQGWVNAIRCHRYRVQPDRGYPQLQEMTWEHSGLKDMPKHPTGFGRSRDVPDDCQHHKQVGATCGVAAVNNLITNCRGQEVDAEHLLAISTRLGEAEAAIRDRVRCVEEAGEEQQIYELYSSACGGHFDVQTLQIAFEEAGFLMWYVPDQAFPEKTELFRHGDRDLAGYVVHRKDPLTPSRDHWLVLRPHGGFKQPIFLLQDSLYDKVFELTLMEARQLLLSLPLGALFAVSRTQSQKLGA